MVQNVTYTHEERSMIQEHVDLLETFESFGKTAPRSTVLMEHIARRLHEKMPRYNWVGFYLVDHAEPNVLVVGPYVGSFAPNTRIPLDMGLCGAPATTGKTIIVDDVRKDPRYLPGSSMVVSEIVVPIFANGKLAGELDVESYFPATFGKIEQEFVEACAKIVGKYPGK